jgi:two-component system, NarL family, nitrate/nitrite response regulator NarL
LYLSEQYPLIYALTMASPIRVGIVDDQQLFLEGIAALLAVCTEVEVIGTAANADQALELCQTQTPDILLLDMAMPGQDGLEVLGTVRAQWPQIKVVMLTVHDDYGSVQECLQKGAMGYILKISGKEELLRAILDVQQGRRHLDPQVLDVLISPPPSKSSSNYAMQPAQSLLSQREQEILGLMAHGKTSEQISGELYISVNTVDTHRKNILAKLEAHNIAEAVRIALKKGLITD